MKYANKLLLLNMFVILLSTANLNASEVAPKVSEDDREYVEILNKSDDTVEQKMKDLAKIESTKLYTATLYKQFAVVDDILRSIDGFYGSAMYRRELHNDYWVDMMHKFDDTTHVEIINRVKVLNDPHFRAKLRTVLDSKLAESMSEVRKRVDSLIQAITYNWDPGLKAMFNADEVMKQLKDNVFENFLNYLYYKQVEFYDIFQRRSPKISDLPKLEPIK